MATRATTSAMMNTLLPMAETEMTEKSLIPTQICDLKHARLYIMFFFSEFVISYRNQTHNILRKCNMS